MIIAMDQFIEYDNFYDATIKRSFVWSNWRRNLRIYFRERNKWT